MVYVLIDDDMLMHELWKMSAKGASVELRCFFSIDEFLHNAVEVPKDAQVYIDSSLKDAKGEEEAYRVLEAGFGNLYIATGYNPEDVQAPDFILGVIGKRPPF